MSADVTIILNGAKAMGSVVSVTLDQGTIALGNSYGVNAEITTGVTNITVTPTGISFVTTVGAVFEGSMKIVIAFADGQVPVVTLDNLSPSDSPPTAGWPTASGLERQILTPGNPLELAGIVDSD